MMKKNIKPICVQGLDCIDNTLISICSYLMGDYKELFWNALQFRYHNDYPIGKGLDWNKKSIIKNAEKLFGIYCKPCVFQDVDQKQRMIEDSFRNTDVIILAVKTNICSWQESYGINKYAIHYLILVDVLEEGIVCNDSMPINEDGFISWNQVQYGVVQMIKVSKRKKNAPSPNLNEVCKATKKNMKISDIKRLKKKIAAEFDIHREFCRGIKLWKVPLYDLFDKVTGAHVQFSQYLSTCLERKDMSAIVLENAVLWEELKLMVAKIYMKYCQNYYISMEEVSNYREWFGKRLDRIILKEEKFVKILMSSRTNKKAVLELNGNKYDTIDLAFNESSHFFTNEYEVNTENLSKLISTDACKKTLNSAFCDGQIILIDKMISTLVLTGYATYGTQFDTIKIISNDDRIIEIPLAFSDWTERSLIQEKVIWREQFKAKEKGKRDYVGKLVEKQIDLDEIFCSSIILPKNRFIHLFNIKVRR